MLLQVPGMMMAKFKSYFRKYDINGDLMWSNTYSNSTANEAYELLETIDGDLCLLVTWNSAWCLSATG